jgi:putative ABC transport system permease protein
MLLIYAFRIVRRGWQKYVLSFVSLFLTATLITVILGLSGSAGAYLLAEQTRIQGGDLVIESNFPLNRERFVDSTLISVERESREQTFTGTLSAGELTTAVSFRIVDDQFPLYGEVQLARGVYEPPALDQIYLDTTSAEKLGVGEGGQVSFGTTTYYVRGIVTREPDALFTGFRFLPQVTLSYEGFRRANISPEFLRSEYTDRYVVAPLSDQALEYLKVRAKEEQARVTVAGSGGSRLVRGLDTVEQFLTIAVLISVVLAGVNVYASSLFLITKLRRSFAILRALGLTRERVYAILSLIFSLVVLGATAVGIGAGRMLLRLLTESIGTLTGIALPEVFSLLDGTLVLLTVLVTCVSAVVPATLRMARMTPQELLMGTDDERPKGGFTLRSFLVPSIAMLPLLTMAMVLLESVVRGLVVVLGVLVVYGVVATVYRAGLSALYAVRARFSFGIRSILAQKRHDGLFGVVAFSSLYIALTAVCTLALSEASLTRYLSEDLDRTLPSVYVIDIQPSQKDALGAYAPELTLFPNVRARIQSIDDTNIQEELAQVETSVDRELGREFNITYRTDLLESERIVAGTWQSGVPGSFSVEQDFAERAGIQLGSRIVLSVQGFPLEGTVTSLRSADTRSGLPFFYFVLPPSDLASFPATYFGYAFLDEARERDISTYVARTLPNVSIIQTRDAGALASELIRTLLTIVFVMVLPPLILACLLIIALIVLTYTSRRRDSARLLVVGTPVRRIERYYLAETVSTTVVASGCAYLTAVGITWFLTTYELNIDSFTAFDMEVVYTILGIVAGVSLLGFFLWRFDTRPLARVLAYEENH